MPRINPIDPATATGKTKQMLDAVQSKLGLIPNLVTTIAASPAALDGYLGFSGPLSGGVLDHKFREQIALAVSQANSCEYCLAAHTALGTLAGLTPEQIASSRASRSTDDKRDAGLKFAQTIVVNRGQVSDADIAKVRAAGFGDAELVEIVSHVALTIYTNYINIVAQTTVDFPRVDVELAATA